jgi:hypothetical protein
VVNIAEPVELYELVGTPPPGWEELKKGYEEALKRFGKRQFHQAARVLGALLAEHPQDGPSLVLMSRAVNYLVEEAADADLAWRLPGK